MAFLVKALDGTSPRKMHFEQLPGNFFRIFFSISRNFTKHYLHAKFQINWTIKTEITEPPPPPPPRPYQFAKSLACLGLTINLLDMVSALRFSRIAFSLDIISIVTRERTLNFYGTNPLFYHD